VIDDLDRTVEAVLRATLPPDLVSQVAISFASPGEGFPPSGVSPPVIDLFLYDLRENPDLRSPERLLDRRPDGSASRRESPARIDCSYLVTAWPSGSSTTPPLDEHHLLGAALRALLRYRTLTPDLLQGTLVDQELPLPTTTLQPGRLQSSGEFWQALGGKPKAAFHYTVTIAVPAGIPIEAGPPVEKPVVQLDQGVPSG
jgi:hypothetical protein